MMILNFIVTVKLSTIETHYDVNPHTLRSKENAFIKEKISDEIEMSEKQNHIEGPYDFFMQQSKKDDNELNRRIEAEIIYRNKVYNATIDKHTHKKLWGKMEKSDKVLYAGMFVKLLFAKQNLEKLFSLFENVEELHTQINKLYEINNVESSKNSKVVDLLEKICVKLVHFQSYILGTNNSVFVNTLISILEIPALEVLEQANIIKLHKKYCELIDPRLENTAIQKWYGEIIEWTNIFNDKHKTDAELPKSFDTINNLKSDPKKSKIKATSNRSVKITKDKKNFNFDEIMQKYFNKFKETRHLKQEKLKMDEIYKTKKNESKNEEKEGLKRNEELEGENQEKTKKMYASLFHLFINKAIILEDIMKILYEYNDITFVSLLDIFNTTFIGEIQSKKNQNKVVFYESNEISEQSMTLYRICYSLKMMFDGMAGIFIFDTNSEEFCLSVNLFDYGLEMMQNIIELNEMISNDEDLVKRRHSI